MGRGADGASKNFPERHRSQGNDEIPRLMLKRNGFLSRAMPPWKAAATVKQRGIAMKNFLTSVLMTSALALGTAAYAEDMPVNSVILSTSGLANFEHRAHVSGNAQLEFPVRYEQVDDILKSLIVFDKQGRIGAVTLPGKQPLAQVFKDLPFTQEQLNNPMTLLNAYQGAEVAVEGPSLKASGKLIQVLPETEEFGTDKQVTRNRISLMTDQGIKSAIMEDLASISFTDPKIKAEVARALDSIRENGTSERRLLTVNLLGEGDRDVTLSYVVDAPLWKTAYRMVVPETGAKKGLLQGWAVVENQTASDWNNVDLTLVSGNPVTFKQELYQSYYVSRPEIPVQVFGRVMPRVDQGAVASAQEVQQAGNEEQEDEGGAGGAAPENAPMAPRGRMGMQLLKGAPGMMAGKKARMALAAASAAPMAADAAAPAEAEYEQPAPNGMNNLAAAANAAQSSEATTQVLFRFPDRFNLKSGQSMMVPFVSREVPMERVSLYQPETHPTHPLAAVEIKNDGDSGLPPGVLTLYEESALLKGTDFVGDAQLPVVGQGEKRLVSYALDSKTTVDRADKSSSVQDKIAIDGGIMRISVKSRTETDYTIKAPEKEERTVILEHPRMGADYQVVQPDPKDVEVTADHYRIRVELKAGEKKTVPVVLENQMWQSYALTGMGYDQLMAYATTEGKLGADDRAAFKKLADKRREIDQLDQRGYALDQKRQTIFSDQQRVRENLRSLSAKSEVQQKYLDKLNGQEDEIEKIDKEKQDIADEKLAKQKELSDLIAGIKI
jgi:hypothetical protein